MPFSFDFDWKNRILRGRLFGQIGDDHLKDYYRTAFQIVSRTQPLAAIIDGSAITEFSVAANTILELAKSPPALPNPNLPRVIIAPSPVFYGMARMFEAQGEPTRPNLHVVRTENEAWAILAVQDPQFEPLSFE